MKFRLLLLIGIAMVPAFAQETIYKFQVPEYDEEGKMKSQVFGDQAEVRDDGKVRVSNFKIELYNKGEVQLRVASPDCVYDRKTKSAESKSDVRIVRDKMIVTGSDFSWDAGSEVFIIQKDAKVVLKDVRKNVNLGEKE